MRKFVLFFISIILLVTMALCCLTSCNGKDYRNDISVSSIDSAIQAKIPAPEGYYSPDQDYLAFYFGGAEDIVQEYNIEMSIASSNINQFGIFHVKEGEAEAMKELCESYIATMKDRWVTQANYIASEHPKMEGAEVRIFGNYVVYTMLTAEDKATAFAAVEELLAK